MKEITGKMIIEAENHVGGLFLALFSDISYCSQYTHLSIERINQFFAHAIKEGVKRGSLFQPELIFLKDFIHVWQESLRLYVKVTATPRAMEYNKMATSCLQILAEVLAELLKGDEIRPKEAPEPFADTILELVCDSPRSLRSIIFGRLVNSELLAKSFFSLRTRKMLNVCLDEALTGPILDRGKLEIFYTPTFQVPMKINKKITEKVVFLDSFRDPENRAFGRT